MDNLHPDAVLIDRLGGPATVAKALGFDPQRGGTQRVTNWKRRGIPELIRLRHPAVFAEADNATAGADSEAAA